MAGSIFGKGGWQVPRTLGSAPGYLALTIVTTTGGALASPPLVNNYKGLISVARVGTDDTYTVTLPGSVGVVRSVQAMSPTPDDQALTWSADAAAGTVTLAFAKEIVGQIQVIVFFDGDTNA